MMGVGSWSTADLWSCEFDWDVMDWPVSPSTGDKAVWFGSAGLAVSPSSKNAGAACDLAAFLAFNEDAQRTSYTTGMSVPTLKDMAYGEYSAMDKGPANKNGFFECAGGLRPAGHPVPHLQPGVVERIQFRHRRGVRR